MPVATECPHCGKSYQVAESTVGKKVKCQSCGQAFVVAKSKKVPATAGAQVAGGKPATRQGGSVAATGTDNPGLANRDPAERARIAKLEAEFGLQPLPPNPNRIFPEVEYRRPSGSPDPLANHVVTDPGFEQVSEAEYLAYHEEMARQEEEAKLDYLAGLSSDDELVTKKSVELNWLYIVAMSQVLGAMLAAAACGISPLGGILMAIPLLVGIFAPAIELFLTLNRHGRLNEIGLLFIPFYNIIYYFMNFRIFIHHFFGSLAIFVTFFGSLLLFGFMVEMMGMDVQQLNHELREMRGR